MSTGILLHAQGSLFMPRNCTWKWHIGRLLDQLWTGAILPSGPRMGDLETRSPQGGDRIGGFFSRAKGGAVPCSSELAAVSTHRTHQSLVCGLAVCPPPFLPDFRALTRLPRLPRFDAHVLIRTTTLCSLQCSPFLFLLTTRPGPFFFLPSSPVPSLSTLLSPPPFSDLNLLTLPLSHPFDATPGTVGGHWKVNAFGLSNL